MLVNLNDEKAFLQTDNPRENHIQSVLLQQIEQYNERKIKWSVDDLERRYQGNSLFKNSECNKTKNPLTKLQRYPH